MTPVKLLRRVLFAAFGALTACSTGSTGLASRGAVADALRPRLVLLYIDLSASMSDTAWTRPVQQLAGETRLGDRVVVFPIGARVPDAPLFDTTLTGGSADRLSDALGLSTRQSRKQHDERARQLASRLLSTARAARGLVGVGQTGILDALCHAAVTAAEAPDARPFSVLLTDGIEESRHANLARERPSLRLAQTTANEIRREGSCPAGSTWPEIRLVGVRHPKDTQALIRWWATTLRGLGYHVERGEIASHPLHALLSASRPRTVGEGSGAGHPLGTAAVPR